MHVFRVLFVSMTSYVKIVASDMAKRKMYALRGLMVLRSPFVTASNAWLGHYLDW